MPPSEGIRDRAHNDEMKTSLNRHVVGKKIESLVIEGRKVILSVEGLASIVMEFDGVREFELHTGRWKYVEK